MKKQIMLACLLSIAITGASFAQQDQSKETKNDKHEHMKMDMDKPMKMDMDKSMKMDMDKPMKMDMDKPMGMTKKYDVSTEFQSQIKGVVDANQQLVDAFLVDDNVKVKSAITAFSNKLDNVDMALLEGEAHHTWMAYAKELNEETAQIAGSNDIGFQRIHLAKLDDVLYKSLKAFGTGGEDVYYNYCPMANNSTGANWLTTSSEIQNPYLGQSMPKCGSNKEVLN